MDVKHKVWAKTHRVFLSTSRSSSSTKTKEPKATTPDKVNVEEELSESTSIEDSLLMDLEQLAISGDYDALSRKAAGFIIDFPEHPQVGMVRAYEEKGKNTRSFSSQKSLCPSPTRGANMVQVVNSLNVHWFLQILRYRHLWICFSTIQEYTVTKPN